MGRRRVCIGGSPEHQLMKGAGKLKPGGLYLLGEQGARDKVKALPEEKGDKSRDSKWNSNNGKEHKVSVWEDPATERQNATSGHRDLKSKIGGTGIPRDLGKYRQ